MRLNKNYQRHTAPGLPIWPLLLVDQERQHAFISFRAVTWHSYRRAMVASKLATVMIALFAGGLLWMQTASLESPLGRGGVAFLGFGVALALAKTFLPTTFEPFLARQVFARRSKIWFTPDQMAFCSPLYENGIVISRNWQDQLVRASFDVAPDPEAEEIKSQPYEPHQRFPAGLQSAQVLRLVITTLDPRRDVSNSAHAQVVRAIPMLPIDLHDAQHLTVVLAVAAELTTPPSFPTAPFSKNPSPGVDIDAITV